MKTLIIFLYLLTIEICFYYTSTFFVLNISVHYRMYIFCNHYMSFNAFL